MGQLGKNGRQKLWWRDEEGNFDMALGLLGGEVVRQSEFEEPSSPSIHPDIKEFIETCIMVGRGQL